MSALPDALAVLESSLGPDRAAAIVRCLITVPGAIEWIREPAVISRLESAEDHGENPATVALLAITGIDELDGFVRELPPALAARREEILAPDSDATAPESPDDVLILVRELIVADQADGVAGVRRLMQAGAIDWRAPMACAWSRIESRTALIQESVESADAAWLASILTAVAANGSGNDVAETLARVSAARIPRLVADLVRLGQTAVANALSGAATRSVPDSKASSEFPSTLRQTLYAGWEAGRVEMAALADSIALAAEAESDVVSALEARRQALQLDPSEVRLAALARTHIQAGQPAEALALLPPNPETPEVEIAAGMALLAGGALEKGRPMLIHGLAGSSGPLDGATEIARSLSKAGEIGLALDLLKDHLDRVPDDDGSRALYADLLLEAGDPEAALRETQLIRLIRGPQAVPPHLEAKAWMDTNRPDKALPILQASLSREDAAHWQKTVECAIAAGATDQAESLLADAPSNVAPAEKVVLHAKTLAARGDPSEAEATLNAATLAHASSPAPWIALAALQTRAGRTADAGDTLQRAAQMAPTSSSVRAALARWLRDDGRPSDALEAAKAARELDPHSVEAQFELGASLLALGREAEALESLREAHRAAPSRQEVRLALARALEATGDRDGAARLFAHLPESAPAEAWFTAARLTLSGDRTPDPAHAHQAVSQLLRARNLGGHEPSLDFWLGRGYALTGKPERAEESFSAFLGRHPADPELARRATLGKASALLALGRAQDSLHDLEVLRSKSPGDPETMLALAHAYAAASLTDEANEAAEAILEIEPDRREVLSILTTAAHRTGNWTKASKALHQAAHHAQADPDLWIESAEAALRQGEPDRARIDVETALKLSPTTDGRRRAAFTLLDLGETERSLSLLLQAAEAEAPDPTVWIEVADVAERAGDRKTALLGLERAAELSPGDAELHTRRATLLAGMGRMAEAIGSWQKALNLRHGDPNLHAALASALIQNGEVEAGLEELSRALAAHPEDPVLLAAAGVAQLRHGSVHEAHALLSRADRIRPEQPDVVLGLGEVLLRLRRPDEALNLLTDAAEAIEASSLGGALRAEAALSCGDIVSAEESLAAARSKIGSDPSDRIALARAELRFGHWRHAIDSLAIFMNDPDPATEHALAETLIGTLEARWLFAEAAQARRHAPGDDVPGPREIEWLEAFFDRKAESTGPAQLLRHRLDLVRASSEDDSALMSLQRACTQAVPSDEAREAVALASLRRQRPLDALQALKEIEPDSLGRSWQAVLAGLAHLQNSNARMAMAAFDDAALDAGIRPLALALYAQAALACDDAAAAIGALNQAVAQWSDEPAWQSALAGLYLEASAPDSALPHLQAAADLDPSSGKAQLALARGLSEVGQKTDALDAYDRAMPFLPEDASVWAEAGAAALECAASAKAKNYFERAIDLEPSEPAHWLGSAQAAFLAGDLRPARRHAEKALELDDDDPAALHCLAEIAAAQGESERALELLDRALGASKESRHLQLARARLLIQLERPEDAADDLQIYLADHDGDEDAWHIHSQAKAASGDLAEAIRSAETAVRLAPRAVPFRLELARLVREAGQLDRALDELNQAQALSPLDPSVALEMGRVFEARRELDRALEAYERSTELDPHSPEAFRRAAGVFKALKAYRDAGRMLERAAALDPDDASTLQQLAAVRALELVHGGSYSMAVNP